jgi:rubredoxin
MFKCTVCGYIADEMDFEVCPKCGAPKEKFEELAADAAQKIDRSRVTNGLHVAMMNMLEEVQALAEEGINDDLDPNCVKIFQQAAKQSEILVQSIKAELQGHMTRGKWG